MSPQCFRKWFKIERYWGGKLIYFSIRHWTLILDFRKNWLADMKKQ